RKGEILFIDARKLGRLENRVNCVFDDEDIQKIAETYHSWRHDEDAHVRAGSESERASYSDILGFCRSVGLDEVRAHDYVLTPGRYVGSELTEDDHESFAEKIEFLAAELNAQFTESESLEQRIQTNLRGLGYGA